MESDDAPKAKNVAYNPDPMGSMIQNEISSIKDASIKAAKEKDEWKYSVWQNPTELSPLSNYSPKCISSPNLNWNGNYHKNQNEKQKVFDLDKGQLYWHI